MNHKCILLDLDGTLTDSSEGITKSVAYALSQMGIHEVDLKALEVFIGPPLKESFMKHYKFTEAEAIEAIDYYRIYFKDKGIYENQVYDGIEDLLKALKAKNYTVVLATSKPTVFAETILAHFNLEGYFDFVVGSFLDGRRSHKHEVIFDALAIAGENDVRKAIMVGDRKYDILGAKSNGVLAIGVTYGFGDREELEKAGADFIATSVLELKALLLG